MPIYDFECDNCDYQFEYLSTTNTVRFATCPKCNEKAKRIFPQKAANFNLKYNPKTDICDWGGNTTKYWDEYKKMKDEGKKPRIPSLDGDG